jgi:hypothetical protein
VLTPALPPGKKSKAQLTVTVGARLQRWYPHCGSRGRAISNALHRFGVFARGLLDSAHTNVAFGLKCALKLAPA